MLILRIYPKILGIFKQLRNFDFVKSVGENLRIIEVKFILLRYQAKIFFRMSYQKSKNLLLILVKNWRIDCVYLAKDFFW